jgi:hypothetical protein
MRVLQKQKDKKFTILHLTDTHLYHGEWIGEKGEHLKRTVDYLVEQAKPDLITISGDLAWTGQYDSYTDFADWMAGYGIPWAPVFGNHDDQGGYEAVCKAAEILLAKDTCLLEAGDPALGYGNYVVGIEEEGRLIHGVILMDSHDRKPWIDEQGVEQNEWAELIPAQFPWYRGIVEELKAKGAAETSLIMHIPIYAYRDAIKAALKADVDPKAVPLYNGEQVGCWNEGYEDSFGVYREGICSYPVDNGFFEEILAGGTTKTVISGHDHPNTFSVPYKGVRLTYALKTGHGSYYDERLNGGTILTIDSDGKMEVEHCFYREEA